MELWDEGTSGCSAEANDSDGENYWSGGEFDLSEMRDNDHDHWCEGFKHLYKSDV